MPWLSRKQKRLTASESLSISLMIDSTKPATSGEEKWPRRSRSNSGSGLRTVCRKSFERAEEQTARPVRGPAPGTN